MRSIITLFSLLLLLQSCKNEKDYNIKDSFYSSPEETTLEDEEGYSTSEKNFNGTYCAEVEYYNPNTGTRNTYDLDVEVEDGYLVQINWPNGGWLDETHFTSEDISSGECEFRSDKGYRYTVTLGEKGGGCNNEGYRLRNDVNEDVEETTCPECGDEKEEYDEYCYYCQKKLNEEKKRKEQEENEEDY